MLDSSETPPATPPTWNVRSVNCVPGSPIDWAAITPTASPLPLSHPPAFIFHSCTFVFGPPFSYFPKSKEVISSKNAQFLSLIQQSQQKDRIDGFFLIASFTKVLLFLLYMR